MTTQDQDAEHAAQGGIAARLHHQAAEILGRRIRSGALGVGTRLLESRVAADFGISRAPARQALAALAAEGLITPGSGRGYVVSGQRGPLEAAGSAPEPVHLSQVASWERIYAEVETGIIARTAFASWRVVEAELARHFGVSRTVARDVVGRLHQRGIIRKDEASRWYAPALTPEHVAELYEMRWMLEPLALVKAADAIPPALIADALSALERAMERAPELQGSDLDVLEAELHVRLLGFCRHRTLMEALRSYQSLLTAHSFLYRWMPPLFPSEPFLPEHHAVLAALKAGRTEAATAALQHHLQASLARAQARIETVAATFEPDPLSYLRPI